MAHTFQVGQILAGSWGYSMTLPEFMRVTRVTESTVWLEPIGKKIDPSRESDGAWSGYVLPDETVITGDAIMRRANGSSVRGPNSHCYVSLWDGKSCYFNHND